MNKSLVSRTFLLGIALSLCVSTSFCLPAFAQTYIFGRADFGVGAAPVALATGDFNGDGRLDLVVANSSDNTVSVLLGKADGTFSPHVDYATGTYPASVAVGDFNNDGNLDFAVANENCTLVEHLTQLSCGSGTVSIFLGNGDGTFLPGGEYATGKGPASVATSDFNGDGKLDLAVANLADSTVSILLGRGDGTFQAQAIFAVTDDVTLDKLPAALVVADFNGDHKLDLAVGVGSVSILLGNGDGTFQAPLSITPNGQTLSIAVGDFNKDGRMDLAVCTDFGDVNMFLGNGDGTFVVGQSYPANFNSSVIAVDLNGDGKLDLAISPGANGSGDSVGVLLGNGDGTFQTSVSYGTPDMPAGLVVADFNGDGKLDIATADGASAEVSILLGLGDGTFVGKTDYGTGNPPQGPDFLTAADFNNDGKLDVAASDYAGEVSVFIGNGDGTFQPATSFPAGQKPFAVVSGDFNNDNNIDLAVVNDINAGSVSILLGNGDGTFQPPVSYATGPGPINLVAGDFNGDGNLDIAVTNYDNGSGNSVSILLGNGDGTFRNQVFYPTPLEPYGIATADFRGNGRLDLAVTTLRGISVLLGNGDGTFQSHTDYPTTADLSLVVTGDFNHDGKLDLAADGQVLLGNGDGTFRAGGTFFSGRPLSVADFNGDGKLDLLAGGSADVLVSIQLGNGDGTFQKPVEYLLSNEFNTGAIVDDFNGDGIPDLVGADSNTATIGVMLSTAFKAVSPTSINFGSQGVGTTSLPQTLTISNSGNVPFNIVSIASSGSFGETNNCGASLSPGSSCTVSVSFSPIATGFATGAITITDSTRSSPEGIPLSGTGVNGPFLTPLPNRLSFGAIAEGKNSTPMMTTLFNTGNAMLTIMGVSITGADSSDFMQNNQCGSTLPPGGFCNVSVTFTPYKPGLRTASATISDSAPGSPHVVPLFGGGLGLALGIAPGSSGSVSVAAGNPANYMLSIGGAGVSGMVTLSCAGAPKGADCSFPGGTSINMSATQASQFGVTVTTTSRTMAALRPDHSIPSRWLWTFAIAGIVFLPASVTNRRRTVSTYSRALSLWVLLFLCSCGGGGGSSTSSNGNPQMNPNGTPVGTYTLTVTAMSNSTHESIPLILKVQ